MANRSRTVRKRLTLALMGAVPILCLLLFPTSPGLSQSPSATGVLRLRVRVKQGEKTAGLSRKRFYLIKGTLDQHKNLLAPIEQQPVVSLGCYYSKLGASQAFITWLKEGDCESVYCREVSEEYISGAKAVPEFVTAYAASEKEFGTGDVARRWLANNLSADVRDGFYKQRRSILDSVIKRTEAEAGTPLLSVMTDRNGTAYFTDLAPGTYVLSSLLPVELNQTSVTWNCEVQIKSGDIATEKPYLVSNTRDRNVKCVAVEKPLPTCEK